MSDELRRLTADLRRSQEQLAIRIKERDEIKKRLNDSDLRFTEMQQELAKAHKQLSVAGTELSITTANLQSRELVLAEQSVKFVMAELEVKKQTKLLRDSDMSLEARTAELERANHELKLTMRRQDEFVAAVTHDLKNPILGATRILEMLVSGSVPSEKQLAVFKQLLETNREMLRLILNMLDVYRHDGGAVTPVFGPVAIATLLKNCVETFMFNIEEKKLSVSVEVQEGAEMFTSDELLLRRVLTNLISNAVKFSKSGGFVKVRVKRDGVLIRVSVQDNGVGMTEEQKQNVFQRFLQPSHDKHCGSGLGLYLSKTLATALRGDLTFTSELQQGSEFILSLPLEITVG